MLRNVLDLVVLVVLLKHWIAHQFTWSEIVAAVRSVSLSSPRCHQSVFIISFSAPFTWHKDLSVGFNKLRHYPTIAPLHRPISSSQSLSHSPCPHHQTEHKEVRSCGSSFSLMLMHILSLLHTNVSWPRLAVCLSQDLHLLSGYWPQFNLTLVTANERTVVFIIHHNPFLIL